jgi:hypothetical protein
MKFKKKKTFSCDYSYSAGGVLWRGGTTFSITTLCITALSIKTLSIMGLFATLSIMTLSTGCRYAKCRNYLIS